MTARPDRLPVAARLLALALLPALLGLAGCRDGAGTAGGAATPTAPASPSTPSSPATGASRSSTTPVHIGRYVAIGDSYTSAPGIGGAQSQDGCLRSDRNYPHLLAAALDVGRLVDVSCGGASTADVRRSQLAGVPPQLDAVTADTDLVTIGLGGNDLQLFGNLLRACVRPNATTATGSPCADTLGSRVPRALARIRRNLVGVVDAVRAKAPGARIMLVGYPQLIPAGGSCRDLPFAPGDYPFAREVNQSMTEAVRQAAEATGATYIDVWQASAGHDICADQPWVNGFSGPGAAPFHPFAAEQRAVARLIAAELS